MNRPVCPLCKSEHFAREPHVFKERVVLVEEKRELLDCPVCEARKKKHREYVRKWRAK